MLRWFCIELSLVSHTWMSYKGELLQANKAFNMPYCFILFHENWIFPILREGIPVTPVRGKQCYINSSHAVERVSMQLTAASFNKICMKLRWGTTLILLSNSAAAFYSTNVSDTHTPSEYFRLVCKCQLLLQLAVFVLPNFFEQWETSMFVNFLVVHISHDLKVIKGKWKKLQPWERNRKNELSFMTSATYAVWRHYTLYVIAGLYSVSTFRYSLISVIRRDKCFAACNARNNPILNLQL